MAVLASAEMSDLPPGVYTLVCVSNHTKGGLRTEGGRVQANLRDAGGRVHAVIVTVRAGRLKRRMISASAPIEIECLNLALGGHHTPCES